MIRLFASAQASTDSDKAYGSMYGLEAHQVLTVITVFVHTNSVRRLAWKFTILPELLRFKVLTLHAISRCIPLCVTVPSLHAV